MYNDCLSGSLQRFAQTFWVFLGPGFIGTGPTSDYREPECLGEGSINIMPLMRRCGPSLIENPWAPKRTCLDPKSMLQKSPKHLNLAQKAIGLHTLGDRCWFMRPVIGLLPHIW